MKPDRGSGPAPSAPRRRWPSGLAAASALVALGVSGAPAVVQGPGGSGSAAGGPPSSPVPRQDGATKGQAGPPRVHDPSLAREGDTYYLFTTGRGISIHTSRDLSTWERRGRVFDQSPRWTAEAVPGSRDSFWAPDVSFFGGRWHLYYSVSTFGKNRSAIGLATNVTLDPGRPDYRWEDRGPVVQSGPGDDWNAIDPNLALDESGTPWLSFGSFWGGLKLREIDPATGKPPVDRPRLHPLASRRADPAARDSIEAPFVIRRGNFFYLFASFDFCCRGASSTYNIRVGRSARITGPYLDREGRSMLEGGGTPVRSGAGRWSGPGHNAVLREGTTDWLVYHAYDAEDGGIPRLRIEELRWDEAGWPIPTGREPARPRAD